MAQITFDFKDLIVHCLHDKEIKFTNAISEKLASKVFISELFLNLQIICQETEIKELFQQEHFHFIQNKRYKNFFNHACSIKFKFFFQVRVEL